MPIKLWENDIFTDTRNRFRAGGLPSALSVARDCYGIIDSSIRQSDGFEANSKNFLIGGHIIKRLATGDVSVLEKQINISRYLNDNGIPTPAIIDNTSGEPITEYDGALWIAMEYLEGDFYSGAKWELEEISRMIPSMMSLLSGVVIDNFPARPFLQQPYTPTNDYGNLDGDVADDVKAAMPDIVELSKRVCEAIPKLNDNTGVVHIDLHPKNIMSSNGRLHILDLDSFQIQSRDIACNFAVYKMMRRCKTDKVDYHRFVDKIFLESGIDKNPLAAQAEILFRLITILQSNSPGNSSVWNKVLPVHIRGLYEAPIILGD